TITLALGSQRMLKRNALIRNLPAVETLGSVTVICADKTGTLTKNEMTVTTLEISGQQEAFPPVDREIHPAFQLPLWIGLLCNDAKPKQDEPGKYLGDPTEKALLAAAEYAGIHCNTGEAIFPRVEEIPFDSERKRMSTIHKVHEGRHPSGTEAFQGFPFVILTKGAVDGLLEVSSKLWTLEGIVDLDDRWRERILRANRQYAKKGIRVLGFAYKGAWEVPGEGGQQALEKDLIFVGVTGLMDPPREEVKAAIASCRKAGVRTIMITGDHPITAMAVARSLNFTDDPKTVTGDTLANAEKSALEETVRRVSIYARVAPADKYRIVQALRNEGEVVAMTGDGINDSPALKEADIGIAMGFTGTGVAREASDMVLLDDNFTTIVAAIEEGRSIFDNLLRFIKFSLGGNLGKVLVMLLAPLFGMLIALKPLQLLWLNLLTDGLMGLGLGMEPAEQDVMGRPPRKKEARILGKRQVFHVTWTGTLIAVITLAVGAYYFDPAQPADPYWQTMLFATLGFTQIGHAIGLRASGHNAFSLTSNPLMTFLTLLTIALQLAAIYLPFFDKFFMLTPLEGTDLLLSIFLGLILLVAVRLEKYWSVRHRLNGG
ncbi:MAG: cation-transporting P-type ATPase, partial [Robiginitalea sp.]|nr:cation-transporting P-type ATPase [Robiginitalea sp.]